jgi:hypothetical protein
MLQGLDTINWASLTHAHGAATNVPGLLRSLLSEDEDVRMQVCAELHETIWHQGTVYSASAAAVPFLYELLTHPDMHDRGCVVSLLCEIATGEGWLQYGIRVDGVPTIRRRLASQGRSLKDALGEERAAMEAIRRDVSAGLRHLLPYLSDREGLAASVADALGHFPEHASWLLPAIDVALASESDEHVRQALTDSKERLLTGLPPQEPLDATPADRARWIFAHPRDSYEDGKRVVELLLAGRDVSELSSEELLLLTKGYNGWSNQAKAFETARLGLSRDPDSAEWLALVRWYVWLAFVNDLPRYLPACDEYIAAGVGPAAFWHLLKADRFIGMATGERKLSGMRTLERKWEDFEWLPGDPIPHAEFLRPAAKALEAALACEPGLRENEDARGWVGDWNARFAAVLQDPEFSHWTR